MNRWKSGTRKEKRQGAKSDGKSGEQDENEIGEGERRKKKKKSGREDVGEREGFGG